MLRDAVRELMADHVIALREVDEDRIVAVAIEHLRAVPHRIVEPVAVMDGRHHRHAGIVDGIAIKHGLVEVGDLACFVEGAFGRRLAGVSRIAHRRARQRLAVLAIIDGDGRSGGDRAGGCCNRCGEARQFKCLQPQQPKLMRNAHRIRGSPANFRRQSWIL